MERSPHDALARRVGGVDRKAALKLLGGALAAVAAARPAAGAAKAGCARKVRRAQAKPCKGAVGDCRAYWTGFCGGNQACLDSFLPCCAHFADCDVRGHFACLGRID